MTEPTTSIDPPEVLERGERVGEYEIVGLIGQGGFGAVYEGVQPIIGKRVAVKVLHRRHASGEGVARLVQEARAVNQIAHGNIVDVFSFGQLPDGRHFFVMDLLRGSTLEQLLAKRGRLPPEEALPILRGVGLALDSAHSRRIAHRDIKPANVFIAVDEQGAAIPKLLDFGLAKHLGGLGQGPDTQSGALMGTPAYMSPEQARGRPVDHRTDIYSFGVLAYETLTGRPPFTGEDPLAVLVKHTADEPAAPSSVAPELDPRLDPPILALLEKDPELRPATLESAVAAIESALTGSSGGFALAPAAPPAAHTKSGRLGMAGVVAAVAVTAWGAWLGMQGSPPATRAPALASSAEPSRETLTTSALAPSASVPAVASSPSSAPSGATLAPRTPVPSATATRPAPSAKHAGVHSPNLDDVEDPFAGR